MVRVGNASRPAVVSLGGGSGGGGYRGSSAPSAPSRPPVQLSTLPRYSSPSAPSAPGAVRAPVQLSGLPQYQSKPVAAPVAHVIQSVAALKAPAIEYAKPKDVTLNIVKPVAATLPAKLQTAITQKRTLDFSEVRAVFEEAGLTSSQQSAFGVGGAINDPNIVAKYIQSVKPSAAKLSPVYADPKGVLGPLNIPQKQVISQKIETVSPADSGRERSSVAAAFAEMYPDRKPVYVPTEAPAVKVTSLGSWLSEKYDEYVGPSEEYAPPASSPTKSDSPTGYEGYETPVTSDYTVKAGDPFSTPVAEVVSPFPVVANPVLNLPVDKSKPAQDAQGNVIDLGYDIGGNPLQSSVMGAGNQPVSLTGSAPSVDPSSPGYVAPQASYKVGDNPTFDLIQDEYKFKLNALDKVRSGTMKNEYDESLIKLFPDLYEGVVQGNIPYQDAIQKLRTLQDLSTQTLDTYNRMQEQKNGISAWHGTQNELENYQAIESRKLSMDIYNALPDDQKTPDALFRIMGAVGLNFNEAVNKQNSDWLNSDRVGPDLEERGIWGDSKDTLVDFFKNPSNSPFLWVGGTVLGATGGVLAAGKINWIMKGAEGLNVGGEVVSISKASLMGGKVINVLGKIVPGSVKAGMGISGGILGGFFGTQASDTLNSSTFALRGTLSDKGETGQQLLKQYDQYEIAMGQAISGMKQDKISGDLRSYNQNLESFRSALTQQEKLTVDNSPLFTNHDELSKVQAGTAVREGQYYESKIPFYSGKGYISEIQIKNPEQVQQITINGVTWRVPADGRIPIDGKVATISLSTFDGKKVDFGTNQAKNGVIRVDGSTVSVLPKPGDLEEQARFNKNALDLQEEKQRVYEQDYAALKAKYATPAKGIVNMNLKPNQLLILDGKPIDPSKNQLGHILTSGAHSVIVQEEGKEDYIGQIFVSGGEEVSFSAQGKDPFVPYGGDGGESYGGGGGGGGGGGYEKPVAGGQIKYGDTCTGALIWQDEIQIAPVIGTAYAVDPGYHSIKMTREGKKPWLKTVYVGDGDTITVSPAFEDDTTTPSTVPPGDSTGIKRVFINSNPSGAQVLLGGSSTGEWTPCYLDLPPGYYTVGIKKTGYATQDKLLYVGSIIAWGSQATGLATLKGWA